MTGDRLPARKKRSLACLWRTLAYTTGTGAALLIGAMPATAEEPGYLPRTTYGEVGLLEIPSARMAPDGEIGLTIAVLPQAQRYIGTFQVLPWFEASFRYSNVYKFFGQPNYYDRSFGLKMRLLQESRTLPEVSLGFRDLLGTGIYSGEYLVASKNVEDFDFTLGVGWGRFAESNALPNPFALIFPSFKTRQVTSSATGTVGFGQFFHGPKIGVFGGVLWRTPIENLNLLIEYSSDRYTLEHSYGVTTVRVPINLGLSYRAFDAVTLSAGWYYGTSYGFTATFSGNPTAPVSPMRTGPELPLPTIRSPQQQMQALNQLLAPGTFESSTPGSPWIRLAREDSGHLDMLSALMAEATGVHNAEKAGRTLLIEASLTSSADAQCHNYAKIASGVDHGLQTIALTDLDDPSGNVTFCPVPAMTDVSETEPSATGPTPSAEAVRAKILADVGAQRIRVEALSISGASLWLYFTNTQYRADPEAVGRIARVLMTDAPPDVELFHIVSVRNAIPLRDYQIARTGLERAATSSSSASGLAEAISPTLAALDNPLLERAQSETYPRLFWAIGPGLHQGLFDPDQPFEIELLAALNASLTITPHFTVETRLEANIFNNFSTSRPSNSELPHVRSDSLLYFREGQNGIDNLRLVYRDRIAPDVFVQAKAGYLESMFGGAGVQVLWRPEGERFAIGVDAYQVWQRNFDRLFGFQDYHVFTGHVTLYYASPWYGLNFNVHAGRYLAGDYGATFEVTRRFSTGVEIGAFATFTNVPFAKFGEGSFDKGILVRIPFEWALPIFSQSSYDITVRSLTRDGGQRLIGDDSLYEETRPADYGEITDHIGDITDP